MKKQNRTSPLRLLSLTLVILILVLTSCTGESTPVGNSPSAIFEPTRKPTGTENSPIIPTATPEITPIEPTPDPLIENPEDLDGVSVRFLHAFPGQAGSSIAAVAREFSLTNPWGIWVNVEAFGSETILIEALQSDLEADDPPQLIALRPASLITLEKDLEFINLSAYFDDPQWGFNPEEQGDFFSIFLDTFLQDSGLTALPIAPSATVLFYNQTWGEGLGFREPPSTAASFRAINCGATQYNLNDNSEGNDGTGGWLINFDPDVLLSWYYAYEGEWQDSQMPVFNNEIGLGTFGTLKAYYDEGCIWIGRRSEPYSYFAERIALMYAGTLEQIPIQQGWMEQADNDDQWSVVGFPGPEEEKILVDSSGLYITETTPEEQLAAWLFAKHLTSPDVEAALIETTFTVPVRISTVDFLGEFIESYPQWARGVDLLDNASFVPISDEWELGQWVLQDAIYQIMLQDADQLPKILEELDQMIMEVTGK